MTVRRSSHRPSLQKQIWETRELYLLLFIPVIWYIVFRYIPLYGIQIAFRDYRPARGFFGSAWVGFKHFERFFNSFYFNRVVGNTLIINFISLLVGFPIPILFAILLNELKSIRYKKVLQNITYIPHFLSAVVLVSILQLIFNPNTGVYNTIRAQLGLGTTNYFAMANAFKPMYILSGLWQNMGWIPSCISQHWQASTLRSTKPRPLTVHPACKRYAIFPSQVSWAPSPSCCSCAVDRL